MPDVRSMFGPVAAKYAASSVHGDLGELDRLVRMVGPHAADRVLAVATGTGNTAFAFAPHVAEVVAYDVTPAMLEQVEIGAKKRGLTNVRVQLGDACAIPEPEVLYDIVVVRLAPHHFWNVEGFVSSAARALRSGGKLLVSDTATPD